MAVSKKPAQVLTSIARRLEKLGLHVEREPALGGLVPDLAFRTQDGKLGVIDLKDWDPAADATRARNLTRAYRDLAGVDSAVVMLPREVKSGVPGLVDRGKLDDWLEKFVEGAAGVKQGPGAPAAPPARGAGQAGATPVAPPAAPPQEKKVFAIMPFDRKYDDTYLVAMVPAAKAIGTGCRRVDKEDYVGDVMARVAERIRSAAAVIVDLSEAKPNVMYELGFAHGAGVRSVLICSTPVSRLPFDVRNQNVIPYRRGQTFELQGRLRARLKSVLSGSD